MYRNYLVTAFRNMFRNWLTTLLNVVGLAMGMAAALLAFLFVQHELSYDRFIRGGDNIAVVVVKAEKLKLTADKVPVQIGAWIKTEFPGIEVTRLRPTDHSVRRGEVEAMETIGWGDSNFFAMFPLPVVAGNLETALEYPDNVVITRGMARKYFGRDAPIGETLEVGRAHLLQVTAVIEDLPAATHLSPEIYGSGLNPDFGLVPLDEKPYSEGSVRSEVMTYMRTSSAPGLSLMDVQQAMPDFVQRHFQKLLSMEFDISFALVPLPAFHLYPSEVATMRPHGSAVAVAAVGSAALLIVAVALINFVNLITGRHVRRAVEVGVRKVSGAARLHLMAQFVGEGLLYAAMGMALAIVVINSLLPAFDVNFAPGVSEQWTIGPLVTPILSVILTIGVLGGIYPALVLSALRPAMVLKSTIRRGAGGALRQVLVLAQFSVLIGLIFASIVIYRQTTFVLRDGLRANHDQILLLFAPCRDDLVNELRGLQGVSGHACSARNPVDPYRFTTAKKSDGSFFNIGLTGVGFGYFELYGIQPVAGRLFTEARDSTIDNRRAARVILNEAAIATLGFRSPEDAVGRTFNTPENLDGPPSEIIGVVPDFAFEMKTMRIPPTMYTGMVDPFDPVISLKLSGREVPETLDAIDAIWKQIGDPRPIRRSFVDQQIQTEYLQTIRQGRLIGALSGTAVVIACLGLFGLAAFTAELRTREIGVRKAMGARTGDILGLLLWQFTKPVLWANLIAWPAGYFAMRRWLEGFAYHIDLSPWMFLGASILALSIAVLTVAGHAFLVARAQPVTALRYE